MFDFVCNHMSAKVNGLKTIYNSSRVLKIFLLPLIRKPIQRRHSPACVTVINAIPDARSFNAPFITFSDDQIDLNYRSPEVCCWRWWMYCSYYRKGRRVCPSGCRWLYVERAGNKLHPSGKHI
ncbi:hypothetical protein DMI70_25055 [Escherichia coli]|nr:hypothetical protein [Escherichia coli]